MERFKTNLYHLMLQERLERYKEIEDQRFNQRIYCYKDRMQFFIIIMKCLTYSEKSGIILNIDRLKDELRLWPYYVNGSTDDEKLLHFGLIPIVMSNGKIEDLNRTISQYLDFFSVEVGRIPGLLRYAYFIQAICTEGFAADVSDKAKNQLINFSYTEVFQDVDKQKIIAFEKARILEISRSADDYSSDLIASGVWRHTHDLPGIVTNDDGWQNLVMTLYSYLEGLGKGQVKAIPYIKRDAKLYNQKAGSRIIHSNFGETVVLKNEKTATGKTIIVNTRYGCYKFND